MDPYPTLMWKKIQEINNLGRTYRWVFLWLLGGKWVFSTNIKIRKQYKKTLITLTTKYLDFDTSKREVGEKETSPETRLKATNWRINIYNNYYSRRAYILYMWMVTMNQQK